MDYARYDDRPKYAKRPFGVEDIWSQEMSYYQTLKSIQNIEQYCESNNINFHWGVFSSMDEDMINILKNNDYGYYSHFVSQHQKLWQRDNDNMQDILWKENSNSPITCHQEIFASAQGLFDFAADLENGPDAAHYGFHRNIHVAETFLTKLVNNEF
jgi:hypothetical protein